MKCNRHESLPVIVLIIILAATYFIYFPATFSPFQFDDFSNLARLNISSWQDFWSYLLNKTGGPTGRPVSKLSFLISDSSWPAFAPDFKLVNLKLHMLNGLLIFWLSMIVAMQHLKNKQLAILGSAIFTGVWLLAPVMSTTVLYVVQRMTILAATFSLFTLILYIKARSIIVLSNTGFSGHACFLFTLSGGMLLLGFLSKENAAVVLYVIALYELLVNRWRPTRNLQSVVICAVLLSVFVLISYQFYLVFHSAEQFGGREYTLAQKIGLFPISMAHYASQFFSFYVETPSFFHGDLFFGYKNETGTLVFYWIVFAGFLFSLFRLRRKLPWFVFGCFSFFATHSLEGGVVPVEIYFEHRNYLPSIFLLVALVGLTPGIKSLVASKIIMAVGVVYLLLNAFLLSLVSQTWSNSLLLAYTWSVEHPYSIRAQRYYSHQLELLGTPANAMNVELTAIERFPQALGAKMNLLRLSCMVRGEVKEEDFALASFDKEPDVVKRKYAYSLVEASEKWVDFPMRGCLTKAQRDAVTSFLVDISENKFFEEDRIIGARFDYLIAKWFVYEGNLDSAVRLLDRALMKNASIFYRTERAIWLMSAGLFMEAKESLESASERELGKASDSELKVFYDLLEISNTNILREQI